MYLHIGVELSNKIKCNFFEAGVVSIKKALEK